MIRQDAGNDIVDGTVHSHGGWTAIGKNIDMSSITEEQSPSLTVEIQLLKHDLAQMQNRMQQWLLGFVIAFAIFGFLMAVRQNELVHQVDQLEDRVIELREQVRELQRQIGFSTALQER